MSIMTQRTHSELKAPEAPEIGLLGLLRKRTREFAKTSVRSQG